MADKNNKTSPAAVKRNSSNFVSKLLLTVLIIVLFAGGSFAVGIFLNLIDGDKLVADLKLNEKPVIGAFFAKSPNNMPIVESYQDKSTASVQPAQTPGVNTFQPTGVNVTQPAAKTEKAPSATAEEMGKIIKAEQQAQAKRIAKLARLYGSMKPEEAVPILNELDDNTVLSILSKMDEEQVAKILAAFDTKRSARLTQAMLRGLPRN